MMVVYMLATPAIALRIINQGFDRELCEELDAIDQFGRVVFRDRPECPDSHCIIRIKLPRQAADF